MPDPFFSGNSDREKYLQMMQMWANPKLSRPSYYPKEMQGSLDDVTAFVKKKTEDEELVKMLEALFSYKANPMGKSISKLPNAVKRADEIQEEGM